MKMKYQRMSKEEKKACKNAYYSTPKGKEMHIRLTRVTIIGILCLLMGCYLLVNGMNNNSLDLITWIMSILLFVFFFIFTIASYHLKIKQLNQYAVKNKIES